MADRRKRFPQTQKNSLETQIATVTQCAEIAAAAYVKATEDAIMKQYGFVGHYVLHQVQGYCNCHTHGFQESFNHADIQLVLDIGPPNAQNVLASLSKRVEAGEIFIPLMRYSGVIRSHQVLFIPAMESGRQVLRLIFPDAAGELRQNLMHPFPASQYTLVT